MNELKTALTSRLKGDATLLSIAGTSAVLLYDKLAPQLSAGQTQAYPYGIFAVQGERPEYMHAGEADSVFLILVKWIDTGESSARVGRLDDRTKTLLSPNDPLPVVGYRTGFQGRTSRVDTTETSSGVKYQHVGGVYRITLIPQ